MRLTKEQRILNTLKNLNLDENSKDLMKYLISIAQNGTIPGFVYMFDEIKEKVFGNHHYRMMNAYKNLLDSGLITLQVTTLIITVWQAPLKTCRTQLLNINNITNIRRYSSICENQIYMSQLNGQNKIGASGSEGEVQFTWNKIKGIIVPRTMAGLFTRKIYSSEKTRLDMAWLLAEEEKRQLDKEEIRFLCGLLAQCNTYGQIPDYNAHYSICSMRDLFEDSSFAVSTGYRVQGQLVDKNIIQIREIKDGRKTLIINGYSDGFGPGKNYVVLPYAIFKVIFKQLELAAINLFFEQVFQLNNGENGKGAVNANKKVNLKALSAPMDSRIDKEKLGKLRNWLRKRNDSEIFKIILSLQEFFDVEDAGRGRISFRIKRIYFVMKNAVRNKEKLFDPVRRYPRKAAIIKDALIKNKVKYNTSEFKEIINVFAHADPRITRRLIKVLAMDIQSRKQHNRPKIKSMAAYVASLYQQYKAGVGKAISNTLAYMASMRNGALEMLSRPIETL